MSADYAPKKQRGRPWKPGQSGNPAGCRTGSRHKATLLAQALLDGEAEGLARKAVEMALGGDTVALKVCLERLVPAKRERAVAMALPRIEGARGVVAASAAVVEAVGNGELTPGEGQALARLLEAHARLLETAELDRRVAALEARQWGDL